MLAVVAMHPAAVPAAGGAWADAAPAAGIATDGPLIAHQATVTASAHDHPANDSEAGERWA